jgi:sulfate/thiosulfate transport system permease protein
MQPKPTIHHDVRRGPPTEPLWVQRLLIAAALLVLIVLIVVPVINIFAYALQDGVSAYFKYLTGDRDTWHAIKLTLFVAPIAVVLNVLFGIAAAWLLTRFQFPGRTLLTSLIDLPFAVSPVVAGLMLVLLFGAKGWFGPYLQASNIKIIFATPGLILARCSSRCRSSRGN